MEYVLVKTDYNWADEADFPSFVIMDKEELEKDRRLVSAYFKHEDSYAISVGVGTNEEIEFESYADVFGGADIESLSENEATIIKDKLGTSFGECTLKDIIYNIQDAYRELNHDEDPDNDKIEAHDL